MLSLVLRKKLDGEMSKCSDLTIELTECLLSKCQCGKMDLTREMDLSLDDWLNRARIFPESRILTLPKSYLEATSEATLSELEGEDPQVYLGLRTDFSGRVSIPVNIGLLRYLQELGQKYKAFDNQIRENAMMAATLDVTSITTSELGGRKTDHPEDKGGEEGGGVFEGERNEMIEKEEGEEKGKRGGKKKEEDLRKDVEGQWKESEDGKGSKEDKGSSLKVDSTIPSPSLAQQDPDGAKDDTVNDAASASKGLESGDVDNAATVSSPRRYTIRDPVIFNPQLAYIGAATPPVEWVGVQRRKLPIVLHESLSLPLSQVLHQVDEMMDRAVAQTNGVRTK